MHTSSVSTSVFLLFTFSYSSSLDLDVPPSCPFSLSLLSLPLSSDPLCSLFSSSSSLSLSAYCQPSARERVTQCVFVQTNALSVAPARQCCRSGGGPAVCPGHLCSAVGCSDSEACLWDGWQLWGDIDEHIAGCA